MDLFADNARLLFSLATVFYLAAFAVGLPALRGQRPARLLCSVLIIGGFVLQTLGLQWRGMNARACPIGNPFEILQFITWSLIICYGFVGSAFRTSLLGFFTAGLAALLSLASFANPAWDDQTTRLFLGQPWIETHAALSTFSYGAFGILALTSGMYLLQSYGLKQHRFEGLFSRLPSLVELEKVNLRLLILSVFVYTFAVAAGVVAWAESDDSVTSLKLIFAWMGWSGYALVLFLRLTGRLFAQKLATACLALFVWALVTLYPVERDRETKQVAFETFNPPSAQR